MRRNNVDLAERPRCSARVKRRRPSGFLVSSSNEPNNILTGLFVLLIVSSKEAIHSFLDGPFFGSFQVDQCDYNYAVC